VPIHAEDYVHRIGRTGRAGLEGRAFTLATGEDGKFISAITALIGKPIPPFTIEGIEGAPLEASDAEPHSRGRGRRSRQEKTPHGRDAKPAPKPAEKPRAEPRRESRPQSPHPRPTQHSPVSMDRFPLSADGKVTPLPSRRHEPRFEDDDNRRVVGFGDHPPAFLARSRKMAP